MKMRCIYFILGLLFCGTAHAQITFEKIDTTMKMGKSGFRVNCRNNNVTTNQLSIRPIGFESPASETINIPMRGRIASLDVDDLNRDGQADLVLFLYTDSAATHGTAFALISDGKTTLNPCALNDPTFDGKINSGYRGHDQYTLLEGTDLLRLPLYKQADKDDQPTGGRRVVQYNFTKDENGRYKFNILRTYDTH